MATEQLTLIRVERVVDRLSACAKVHHARSRRQDAVVTGAASGMERAFADRLARDGMRIVLPTSNPAPLQTAVAELEAQAQLHSGW